MSAKQEINNKLQGSAAKYLRCGGVVNDQIKKALLLNLTVKRILKSVNIWQSYKQERGCLMHFACVAKTLLNDEESGPSRVCDQQARPSTSAVVFVQTVRSLSG